MAIIVRPIDGVAYTAENWRQIWADGFTEGIRKGIGNEFAVTGSATPLAVNTGAAFIQGFYIKNTTSASVTVTTPAATTGGRVIIKTTIATGVTTIEAKLNTVGITTAPSLTQNGTTWETSLASFTVTNTGVITLSDGRIFNTGSSLITSDYLDDNAVGSDNIQEESIDSTKIGNNIPTFSKRQGGSTTDWNTGGITNYDVATILKEQIGVYSVSLSAGNAGGSNHTITFPTAFTRKPHITTGLHGVADGIVAVTITSVTTTGFVLQIYRSNTGSTRQYDVHWRAIAD